MAEMAVQAVAKEERLKRILSPVDIENIACSAQCPYENLKRVIQSHEVLRAELIFVRTHDLSRRL